MSTTASVSFAGSLNEAPAEPAPEHVREHQNEVPTHVQDIDKLYVEITSDGDHADVLRSSAASGLAATPYVVASQQGADIEVHVELAGLTTKPGAMDCKVKMFVLRLPQHDLLAIADGGGRVTGRGTVDACLSTVGTAVVRDKLPLIFQRQLDAKR